VTFRVGMRRAIPFLLVRSERRGSNYMGRNGRTGSVFAADGAPRDV